jgi:hypothetical protein
MRASGWWKLYGVVTLLRTLWPCARIVSASRSNCPASGLQRFGKMILPWGSMTAGFDHVPSI